MPASIRLARLELGEDWHWPLVDVAACGGAKPAARSVATTCSRGARLPVEGRVSVALGAVSLNGLVGRPAGLSLRA
jgi:hypothetical protein